MEETREIQAIKTEVTKVHGKVQDIVIKTDEDMQVAIDMLSNVKDTQKHIQEEKDKLLNPALDVARSIRLFFKPFETKAEEAEGVLKNKLMAYRQEKNRKAEEKEAKIAEKVEAGEMSIEVAAKKVEKIESVGTMAQGEKGSVQFRSVKKVEIVDASLIPRKYLVPDLVVIRKDALAGVQIPGVKVVEEESIAAR